MTRVRSRRGDRKREMIPRCAFFRLQSEQIKCKKEGICNNSSVPPLML